LTAAAVVLDGNGALISWQWPSSPTAESFLRNDEVLGWGKDVQAKIFFMTVFNVFNQKQALFFEFITCYFYSVF